MLAGLESLAKDSEVNMSHTRGSFNASEVSKSKLTNFSVVVLSRIELKQGDHDLRAVEAVENMFFQVCEDVFFLSWY